MYRWRGKKHSSRCNPHTNLNIMRCLHIYSPFTYTSVYFSIFGCRQQQQQNSIDDGEDDDDGKKLKLEKETNLIGIFATKEWEYLQMIKANAFFCYSFFQIQNIKLSAVSMKCLAQIKSHRSK